MAKRAVEVEASGEGGDDEAWNPGGENEPTVEDVQHWDWLEVDLDRLIDEARPRARKRLDAGEFTKEYFKVSLEYLKLDEDDRKRFETAVQAGLTAIDDARKKMDDVRASTKYDEAKPDSTQVWQDTQAEFLARQKKAANGLVQSLPARRRTTLMREQALYMACSLRLRDPTRKPCRKPMTVVRRLTSVRHADLDRERPFQRDNQ